MTLFICTAGTSIADGPMRVHETLADFRARIEKKAAGAMAYANGNPIQMLVKLSAETNALARADCGPGDDVLVLATDTADGQEAAEAVVRIVADMLGAKGRTCSVQGLQVSEAGRFRQSGIRNLIDIVVREIGAVRARGSERVIFNITGGFKGVVPYLTLLGMLNGIETVYVYDQSDVLIRLPPLPLRFDHDRIAFALPALRLLQTSIMEEEKFRRLLPGRGWNDDPVFKDLIEAADGFVTLSGAGELALRGLATRVTTYSIKLHPNARASSMMAHEKALRALEQMTTPESFLIPQRAWEIRDRTDMLIWKTPRSPAAPRLFYWLEQNEVFVAEILHHEVYEREVIHGDRRIWRRDYTVDRFTSYVSSSSVADPLTEALSDWISELDEERSTLEARAGVLKRRVKELQDRIADASGQHRQLQQMLTARGQELDVLRSERDELTARLAERESGEL